jgi:hypothetical protein
MNYLKKHILFKFFKPSCSVLAIWPLAISLKKKEQHRKHRQHNEPIRKKNIGALPEDDVVKRRNMSEWSEKSVGTVK